MTTINAVAPYQGLLHWVDQPREGANQSTGTPWKSVQFVLKYLNHQMKEEFIVFDLQGVDNVNKLLSLPLGTEIRVSWRPQARSYTDKQGATKWFGAFNAFNFHVGPFEQPQAQPAPQPAPQPAFGGYPPQGGYQQGYAGQPAYQPQPGYAPQPAYQPAPAPVYQPQPQAPAQPAPAPAPAAPAQPQFPNGETNPDDLPW